jgi:hypothetical protein
MWLNPLFERFVDNSPVTVIVRTLMESVLAEDKLDALFEQTAQTGYTREILFSSLVTMMVQVVCSVHQSIGSVFKVMAAEMNVTKSAVYGKLNRLETCLPQALVRSTDQELSALLGNMGAQHPNLLSPYRQKILDGNGLGATEHRLDVLRNTGAVPYPVNP